MVIGHQDEVSLQDPSEVDLNGSEFLEKLFGNPVALSRLEQLRVHIPERFPEEPQSFRQQARGGDHHMFSVFQPRAQKQREGA